MRNSVIDVIECICKTKRLRSLVIISLIYFVALVFLLDRIGLWKNYLMKSTVLWYIFSAVNLMFLSITESKSVNYFKNLIFDNIKIMIIVKYIVSTYTFNLWKEIIIVPIIVVGYILLSCMQYKNDKKYKKEISIIENLIGWLVLLILIGASYNFYETFNNINLIGFMREITISIILLIGYIPFLYIVTVIVNYETLFINLKLNERCDEYIKRYCKIKTILFCNINLNRVVNINQQYGIKFINIIDKEDYKNIIKSYKKSV